MTLSLVQSFHMIRTADAAGAGDGAAGPIRRRADKSAMPRPPEGMLERAWRRRTASRWFGGGNTRCAVVPTCPYTPVQERVMKSGPLGTAMSLHPTIVRLTHDEAAHRV